MSNRTNRLQLPTSREAVYGILHIREGDPEPLTWEFAVSVAGELKKLPNYPVTHKVRPEGIGVTITDGRQQCETSFHGYDEHARYGKHFYIGSALRRMGPKYTQDYRYFLSKAFGISLGTDRDPIDVRLEFRAHNTIFVSRC